MGPAQDGADGGWGRVGLATGTGTGGCVVCSVQCVQAAGFFILEKTTHVLTVRYRSVASKGLPVFFL